MSTKQSDGYLSAEEITEKIITFPFCNEGIGFCHQYYPTKALNTEIVIWSDKDFVTVKWGNKEPGTIVRFPQSDIGAKMAGKFFSETLESLQKQTLLKRRLKYVSIVFISISALTALLIILRALGVIHV